jgi:hypothetical protein
MPSSLVILEIVLKIDLYSVYPTTSNLVFITENGESTMVEPNFAVPALTKFIIYFTYIFSTLSAFTLCLIFSKPVKKTPHPTVLFITANTPPR